MTGTVVGPRFLKITWAPVHNLTIPETSLTQLLHWAPVTIWGQKGLQSNGSLSVKTAVIQPQSKITITFTSSISQGAKIATGFKKRIK